MGSHSADIEQSSAINLDHGDTRGRMEGIVDHWLRRLNRHSLPSFSVLLPNGKRLNSTVERPHLFEISVHDRRGFRALASGHEVSIADAYVRGNIDILGDFFAALSLRSVFKRQGALSDLRYRLNAYFLGQTRTDRSAIQCHYEYPDEFYTSFLDDTRTYSHGVYENDGEPLDEAMTRKLNYVLSSCHLGPGSRVLDVGGGWGAFTEFAGKRGIQVTSLTISQRSKAFIEKKIQEELLPCAVLNENFLEHSPNSQYDAVVILGVLEHLPRYARVMKSLRRLTRPGGRVYIDGSAANKMNSFNGFFKQYVYPGNHCPIHLPTALKYASQNELEVESVLNDRHSYFLTAKAWAENLEQARSTIEDRFGAQLFRVFRLYLWGVCRGFAENRLQAYRIVLKSTK